MDENKIIEVKDLHLRFYQEEGIVKALNGVSFDINKGQSIGLVGESGCGKSVTAYSLLRILPASAKIISGSSNFRKRSGEVIDLTKINPDSEEIRKIRGAEISIIFQEPMTAFSPLYTIGNQICENLLLHQDISPNEARDKAIDLLRRVGISNPDQRVDEYSFQFSGGMRQRAMIAMAIACDPRVLIADEPTTALDVTIQAQVLRLINDMKNNYNLSLMLITHDLGVIAHMVDHIYVMYLGSIMEHGPIKQIFKNPQHPYTRDLLKSIPKVTGTEGELASIEGTVPDAYNLPDGCPFHTRCREKIPELCTTGSPKVTQVGDEHYVSCYKVIKEGVDKNVQNT